MARRDLLGRINSRGGAALDARSAVVFVHPAEFPGPPDAGFPPFAADFLLDTTRAAYLLVRNGIRVRYPNIRFILGHAGGFVPYASHRIAIAIFGETGRSIADILADFAFADPGHITFGSDWPFAPLAAGQYFAAGLDSYPGLDPTTLTAINRANAVALFRRLGVSA